MKDYNRESVMIEWDRWREYIASGGKGSWPREAFESLLDYFEEQINLSEKE